MRRGGPDRGRCAPTGRPRSAASARRAGDIGGRRPADDRPRADARSRVHRRCSPAQRLAGRRGLLEPRPARGTRARLSRRPKPNTASRNDPVWVVSRLIESRIPIAARLMVSADPPALMNGSGMPVTGRSAVTTIMLTKAWAMSHVVMPHGEQPGERVRRIDGDPVALVGDDDEQGDDRERADKTPLLADDREDEVRRGRRQIEELLAALTEPKAGDPSQGERHQRLDRVVPGVERVAERVEERLDTLHLVGGVADHPPAGADDGRHRWRPGRRGWRPP